MSLEDATMIHLQLHNEIIKRVDYNSITQTITLDHRSCTSNRKQKIHYLHHRQWYINKLQICDCTIVFQIYL